MSEVFVIRESLSKHSRFDEGGNEKSNSYLSREEMEARFENMGISYHRAVDNTRMQSIYYVIFGNGNTEEAKELIRDRTPYEIYLEEVKPENLNN